MGPLNPRYRNFYDAGFEDQFDLASGISATPHMDEAANRVAELNPNMTTKETANRLVWEPTERMRAPLNVGSSITGSGPSLGNYLQANAGRMSTRSPGAFGKHGVGDVQAGIQKAAPGISGGELDLESRLHGVLNPFSSLRKQEHFVDPVQEEAPVSQYKETVGTVGQGQGVAGTYASNLPGLSPVTKVRASEAFGKLADTNPNADSTWVNAPSENQKKIWKAMGIL